VCRSPAQGALGYKCGVTPLFTTRGKYTRATLHRYYIHICTAVTTNAIKVVHMNPTLGLISLPIPNLSMIFPKLRRYAYYSESPSSASELLQHKQTLIIVHSQLHLSVLGHQPKTGFPSIGGLAYSSSVPPRLGPRELVPGFSDVDPCAIEFRITGR
jgi:hypothetical protein